MNESAARGGPALVGVRLSVMMFLQFFVWGAWYLSMTGWMGVQGIDGLTAWAYTVGPIAAIISRSEERRVGKECRL